MEKIEQATVFVIVAKDQDCYEPQSDRLIEVCLDQQLASDLAAKYTERLEVLQTEFGKLEDRYFKVDNVWKSTWPYPSFDPSAEYYDALKYEVVEVPLTQKVG